MNDLRDPNLTLHFAIQRLRGAREHFDAVVESINPEREFRRWAVRQVNLAAGESPEVMALRVAHGITPAAS